MSSSDEENSRSAEFARLPAGSPRLSPHFKPMQNSRNVIENNVLYTLSNDPANIPKVKMFKINTAERHLRIKPKVSSNQVSQERSQKSSGNRNVELDSQSQSNKIFKPILKKNNNYIKSLKQNLVSQPQSKSRSPRNQSGSNTRKHSPSDYYFGAKNQGLKTQIVSKMPSKAKNLEKKSRAN